MDRWRRRTQSTVSEQLEVNEQYKQTSGALQAELRAALMRIHEVGPRLESIAPSEAPRRPIDAPLRAEDESRATRDERIDRIDIARERPARGGTVSFARDPPLTAWCFVASGARGGWVGGWSRRAQVERENSTLAQQVQGLLELKDAAAGGGASS